MAAAAAGTSPGAPWASAEVRLGGGGGGGGLGAALGLGAPALGPRRRRRRRWWRWWWRWPRWLWRGWWRSLLARGPRLGRRLGRGFARRRRNLLRHGPRLGLRGPRLGLGRLRLGRLGLGRLSCHLILHHPPYRVHGLLPLGAVRGKGARGDAPAIEPKTIERRDVTPSQGERGPRRRSAKHGPRGSDESGF